MKQFILLLTVVFSVTACEAQTRQQQSENGAKTEHSITKKEVTSVETAALIRQKPDIRIIDVRTPGEFQAGHLKGAENIDIGSSDFYPTVNKLDKNAVYLVYCRTRNRSNAAVDYMMHNGFKHIYQMSDGFYGWSANNLPVEK